MTCSTGLADGSPSRVSGGRCSHLARDLLERADAFRAAATFHASGHLDQITIGAPTVTLTEVVAPFIVTLGSDDPAAAVFEADARDPVAALRCGADLAIGTVSAGAPYRSSVLALLPVWAYVTPEHEWAGRESALLGDVLAEPVIVLPPSVTSRQALETPVAATGATYTSIIEAANGTVAQALAAAGRGIAVVSDDPRFGLVPVAIDAGGLPLSVRLIAVWDTRHAAEAVIEDVARRLRESVRDRYGVPAE